MDLLGFREAAVKSCMEDWKLAIQEKTHHPDINRIVKGSGYANYMDWKENGRAEWMWCGIFCACHLRNIGFHPNLRPGLWHVKNVENFFTYQYEKRVPRWITVDGKEYEVKVFHEQKNAPRMWLTHQMIVDMVHEDGSHMVGFSDVGLVGPGDILLVDGNGDGSSNHITMVASYENNIITTVEGNAGGLLFDGENLDGTFKTKEVKGDGVTLNKRDLSNPSHLKKIYGIGRFSAEDFNGSHTYE